MDKNNYGQNDGGLLQEKGDEKKECRQDPAEKARAPPAPPALPGPSGPLLTLLQREGPDVDVKGEEDEERKEELRSRRDPGHRFAVYGVRGEDRRTKEGREVYRGARAFGLSPRGVFGEEEGEDEKDDDANRGVEDHAYEVPAP